MAYNGFYPPMFPQPCGNIYNIQNSLEVANIPTGAGMTAALCAPENILYLKVMQNGVPSLVGYKLTPMNEPQKQTTSGPTIEERLTAIEERLNKIGVKNDDNVKQPIHTKWA